MLEQIVCFIFLADLSCLEYFRVRRLPRHHDQVVTFHISRVSRNTFGGFTFEMCERVTVQAAPLLFFLKGHI